jgi:hypothetical protein
VNFDFFWNGGVVGGVECLNQDFQDLRIIRMKINAVLGILKIL